MTKLSDYMKVTDAAAYLGICPNTLRNWERAGKILAHRNPVNGYRLFRREELDELLKQVQKPTSKPKINKPKKPK